MRILNVVGARPNLMKIAPIMSECRAREDIEPILIHTGQHYDERMSELFFRELGIPEPDRNLGVGSGSQAAQTARIMEAFEPVLLEYRPDAVLVVGDVNSTIACGLVAAKLAVPLVHVEAGLRSFDRSMPEEINRVLTDSISDLLFCTETSGVENLRREGIPAEKIFLVGNVMIDTLLRHRERASESGILDELNLRKREYAVLTLHRPHNVDNGNVFSDILDAVDAIRQDLRVIFPVHPRTRAQLEESSLGARLQGMKNVDLVAPLGYLDFLRLLDCSRLVLTDSGGIQEETTILKLPCLTLRENTERPATVEAGGNRIVGARPERILEGYRAAMRDDPTRYGIPPLWDGHAAKRIVEILRQRI